jgi:hypothetical protein
MVYMAAGRPTTYSEEMLDKAKEYLASCEDIETEREVGQKIEYRLNVKLPTIQGLAVYLGVSRDSIYEWSSKYPEFSDTIEQIITAQADKLINQGLAGNYNSTIAKLMLSSNHNMREKSDTDVTTGGNPVNFVLSDVIANKNGIDTQAKGDS